MQRFNKVPQVSTVFWAIKILTTGMGEALADYFDHAFDPLIVVAISALVLMVALCLQFRASRFVAWRYWSAVAMVSVFGTMAADAVHVILNVPYWVSTLFFSISLVVMFITWHAFEKNISISQIDTVRREVFYWFVVMTTFALGTASGDMTAMSFNWGFLLSGVIFTAAFALPMVVNASLKLNSVSLFWLAYVITRPLGASFADWMALPPNRGGLGWGTLPVSLVLIFAIAAFVALNRKKAKV